MLLTVPISALGLLWGVYSQPMPLFGLLAVVYAVWITGSAISFFATVTSVIVFVLSVGLAGIALGLGTLEVLLGAIAAIGAQWIYIGVKRFS
jgi:hypothetical protein